MSVNSSHKTHPLYLLFAIAVASLIGNEHWGKTSTNIDVNQGLNESHLLSSASLNSLCNSCGIIVDIHKNATEYLNSDPRINTVIITKNKVNQSKNIALSATQIGTDNAYTQNLTGDLIENNPGYTIKIRMHNNSFRTITLYSLPQHVIGQRVKFQNGNLTNA
jgi:hypothetical protein